MIKSICVFCGASNGFNKNYASAAKDFGKLLANNNIELIYGGGSIGIMNEIAETVLELGGKVTGVITHHLMGLEVGHEGITKMHYVDTLQERKALQLKISDAFVVLPGGYGTMDEFFEVLVHNQLNLLNKPLGILNTDNFYKPLIELIKHFTIEGFASEKLMQSILIDNNPVELFNKINHYSTKLVQTA